MEQKTNTKNTPYIFIFTGVQKRGKRINRRRKTRNGKKGEKNLLICFSISHWLSQYLLWVVPVSAMSRRSISYTPMADTAFTHGRLCRHP